MFSFFAFVLNVNVANAESNYSGPVLALFWITTAGSVVVGGFVFILGGYYLYKYRESNTSVKRDKVVNESKYEKLWLSFAILLVVVLVVISTPVLYSIEAPTQTAGATVIDVEAHQWYWNVDIPAYNVSQTSLRTTSEQVTLYTNTLYELNITSKDVAHSFFVYDLAIKVDAIPGQANTRFFKINDPGNYVVTCAEYCGVLHYSMQFTLHVVDGPAPAPIIS